MRQLILHRERALAGFAIPYFCVLNRDAAEFLQALEADPATARFAHVGDYALRNGETVKIPLDEGETTLFVVIYTDARNIVTNTVTIAPGNADAAYTILTEYDGFRKLQFRIVPTE